MKSLSQIAINVAPSATLEVDSLAKKMKAEGKPVIAFGTGEPDFATPDSIKQAAIAAVNANRTKYTQAAGLPELCAAAAERLNSDCGTNYKAENIAVASGAKHSIFIALMCLLNPGDEVILPAPYWVTYYEAIRFAGAIPVVVTAGEADDFLAKARQIEDAVTSRTKLLILNNPSNPTGMLYSEAQLKEIAAVCARNDLYIMSDEIYYRLVYDGRRFTSVAALGGDLPERTILINGVSKSYAMTGWRIGYSASSAYLAKLFGNYLSHSTSAPSTISQIAAIEALTGEQNTVEEMRRIFEERRDFIVERVKSIRRVSCTKPDGAFYVMLNVKEAIGAELHGKKILTAGDFALALLEKEYVAMVDCDAFGAPGYLRLTYAASMDDIREGLDRLERFVNG